MKFLVLIALAVSANAASLPALSMPTLPSIPSGGLTYYQMFNLVTEIYKSPIAKFLPSFTQTLKFALEINSASNTVSESMEKLEKYFHDEAAKGMAAIQGLVGTTPSPSVISSIFSSLPKPSAPSASILPSMPSFSSLTG